MKHYGVQIQLYVDGQLYFSRDSLDSHTLAKETGGEHQVHINVPKNSEVKLQIRAIERGVSSGSILDTVQDPSFERKSLFERIFGR